MKNTKTITCACGKIVDVSGVPENPIYGTCRDKPAVWYGCTNPKHKGQALMFYCFNSNLKIK